MKLNEKQSIDMLKDLDMKMRKYWVGVAKYEGEAEAAGLLVGQVECMSTGMAVDTALEVARGHYGIESQRVLREMTTSESDEWHEKQWPVFIWLSEPHKDPSSGRLPEPYISVDFQKETMKVPSADDGAGVIEA